MKHLLPLIITALSAFAADAPKPAATAAAPIIDPALQIEVLATQYDLVVTESAAQSSAARFEKDVAAKQAEAAPAMEKAAKACGDKFQPAARDHKVICAAAPVAAPAIATARPAPSPATAK